MRSQFQYGNQKSHLEFSEGFNCVFQIFHDLSIKQVTQNRSLGNFPSLGSQKESKASVGFLCIQVGEDDSSLRRRPKGSHTEHTLEQTNGSNELATAAFFFLFPLSHPFFNRIMGKSLL